MGVVRTRPRLDSRGSADGGASAQILLIHGLGRTPRSLASLARHLRRSGHQVHGFGYFAATQPVDQIVGRVHARLDELGSTTQPLVVIGHSLGGILVRAALALEPSLVTLPQHLVMLGPPNQPPRLAGRLHRNWLYRIINGEAGQRLADPDFTQSLPPLTIPHTIIAGTGGPTGRWSPFGNDSNDTIVAVSETRCTADEPVTLLPVRHTFMMNDPRVRAVIDGVLAQVKPG